MELLSYCGNVSFLPTNIRLGWKWKALKNTLGFVFTALITTVKSVVVQAEVKTKQKLFSNFSSKS
jgi:hypothetical protein